MQLVKKQLEYLLIHYFRECYNEFPKGKLIATESPDFVLKMKSRQNLGIELTRLNPFHAAVQNKKEAALEVAGKKIIEQTRELFMETSRVNLFVKFLFSENKIIIPERIPVLSAKLANSVRCAVKGKSSNSYFHEIISGNSLPEDLQEVLILHHPKLKVPVWELSNNLGISENVPEDIQLTIQKKDEKLILYQKQQFNSYWLIITTDRLRGTKNYNLQNKILKQQFHSRFQQVFLFDLMRAKIFRLV
ncbi:MAG: hypothetical protein ACOCWD_03275 [Tangfeifania sp.]